MQTLLEGEDTSFLEVGLHTAEKKYFVGAGLGKRKHGNPRGIALAHDVFESPACLVRPCPVSTEGSQAFKSENRQTG